MISYVSPTKVFYKKNLTSQWRKAIQEYLYSVIISDEFWFPAAQTAAAKATVYTSSHS